MEIEHCGRDEEEHSLAGRSIAGQHTFNSKQGKTSHGSRSKRIKSEANPVAHSFNQTKQTTTEVERQREQQGQPSSPSAR